jgi:hypothetical protein
MKIGNLMKKKNENGNDNRINIKEEGNEINRRRNEEK